MKCQKCHYEFEEGNKCPLCGHENTFEATVEEIIIPRKQYPMKWYKFTKILLLLGVFINFANALSFLTGTRYEGKGLAEAVYAAVPALKGFDIFSGLYCIAMAIFAIVIFAALSGYRAIAPKLLVTMYITSIAFSLITMIWLSGIIGGAETTVIYGETYEIAGEMYRSYIDLSAMNNAVSTFVSMGVSLSLAIYNYRYYKERDELFLK